MRNIAVWPSVDCPEENKGKVAKMSFRTNIIAGAIAIALSGLALTGPAMASDPGPLGEVAERKAANEKQLAAQRQQMATNAEARAAYEAAVAEHAIKLEAWRAAQAASEDAERRYEQAMSSYRQKYGHPGVSGS